MKKLLTLTLLLLSFGVSAHPGHPGAYRHTEYRHTDHRHVFIVPVVITTGQQCSTQPGEVVNINGVNYACICDISGYCHEQQV